MATKRLKRLESKKRKAEAFLRLAEVNDRDAEIQDRRKRKLKLEDGSDPPASSDSDSLCESCQLPPPAKKAARAKEEKPFLEGAEYEELRNRLRERKKALQRFPHFMLKTPGNDAELALPEQMRTPLFMKDLQNFLLYSMLGAAAPVEPSRWCKFSQWNKLGSIVLAIMDGVGLREFERCQPEQKFRKVASILTHKLCFISPASYESSVPEDLCVLPLSVGQKSKLRALYGSPDAALALDSGNYFRVLKSIFPMARKKTLEKEKRLAEDRSHSMPLKLRLMLTMTQLVQEGFPLPLRGGSNLKRFQGFVRTKDRYEEVSAASPMYSVDCEMCLTSTKEHELAKICVVDSDLKVVYSALVKPENSITNYLTKFSGITQQMLSDVTTKLKDVQDELRRILPADAILVGHSLNSDLKAMKMFHPYVIDTSVIYCTTGARGRKNKLKDLSMFFLGRKIQERTEGHDPEEDALAAMELVLLKLENGYHFGDMVLEGEVPNQRDDGNDSVVATSIMKTAEEKTISVIGCEAAVSRYNDYFSDRVTFRKVSGNKEAVEECCRGTAVSDLSICHVDLREKVEGEPPGEEPSLKLVKSLKKWTKRLWSGALPNSLFVSLWPGSETSDAFVGIAIKKDLSQA